MRFHLYFRAMILRSSAQMVVINSPTPRDNLSPTVCQACLEHYENDAPLKLPKKDRLYPASASAKIASTTPVACCVGIISRTRNFYNVKCKTSSHYQRQNMLMHSLNLILGAIAQNWLKQYQNIKAKTVFDSRLTSLFMMKKLKRLTR